MYYYLYKVASTSNKLLHGLDNNQYRQYHTLKEILKKYLAGNYYVQKNEKYL